TSVPARHKSSIVTSFRTLFRTDFSSRQVLQVLMRFSGVTPRRVVDPTHDSGPAQASICWAGIFRRPDQLRSVQQLAHDDHRSRLFRLPQPGNHRSKFVEYLVPALKLTAFFRALHRFISHEGEFCLAVSELFEDGHVVRTLDGLMFYSQLRRIDL